MRSLHAAACVEHGGDRPQLVITGGWDDGDKVLNDVWIMDVQSGRWKKVIHAFAKQIISSEQFFINHISCSDHTLYLTTPTPKHSFRNEKLLFM